MKDTDAVKTEALQVVLSEKKQDARTVKLLPTVKFHRNMFNISYLSVNVKE